MHTRYALIGLLTASLVVPVRAAAANGPWDSEQGGQTEKFSRTVPLGKSGTVTVANVAGDIVVTGGPGEQVVIEALKRARTAEGLQDIQIEVLASEGRVEILTRYSRRGEWHRGGDGAVNYTVRVPRGASVRTRSVSGGVSVSAVDGELQAETISGDVRVTEAGQLDRATTVSGDVVVKSAASPGTLTVSSVSGDVSLTAVKARAIESSSVSGDLRLTDVISERVSAKSISGTLDFGGPLARAGQYAFKSHSGDIIVRVTNNAGFEVAARSFSGDIQSELPLTVRFGGDEASRGRPRRQDIRGTFGDGSASLEITSFSGDIRIANASATKK